MLTYEVGAINRDHNFSQDFWEGVDTKDKISFASLNKKQFESALESSPNARSQKVSNVILKIPLYNGDKKLFKFFESNVLPSTLKVKYPSIKSYIGIGIENPSYRSSIVSYDGGLYGLVLEENGRSYIYVDKHNNVKIRSDDNLSNDYRVCNMNQYNNVNRDLNDDLFWECVGTDEPCNPVGTTLTKYRFAGIMSERANNEVSDGTIQGGLAWMVSIVNQINLLWIRELGFQLIMVDESDELIFTDENPAPDVFQKDPSCHSSGDPKYCELEEVKPYLESIIGPGGDDTPLSERKWEYGAHFDTRYNGGVAYMPGSTSTNNPSYEVFNHELGHNLGSPHNISIENGWRCTIGGTIMGSRIRTLSGFSGDQYSSHTIELAMNYKNDPMIYQDLGIWGQDYVRGYSEQETGNVIPELVIPLEEIIVPKETPFVLEGFSLPYSSEYTFSWEQNDASDESFSMNPLDNSLPYFLPDKGPLFSTVDPTSNGYRRYFPNLETLLQNNYETVINDYGTLLTVEKLPFSTREINMRLIVRTNDPYSGALNHKNIEFLVAGTAGPFRLTSQQDSSFWEVGSEQTITWDVANTNDPDSVNCQLVNLYLSLDGEPNFNYLLGQNIANNGSWQITIPPLPPSNSARLMVKAADNIFFDINNGIITIINQNTPSVTLSSEIMEISMPPDSLETYDFNIYNSGEEGSILAYRTSVGMEYIINESFEDQVLPEGWSDTTNADCENPGWFITEDASSSYFNIPFEGDFYIAVNDDACNSDGSNDLLLTNEIYLPEGYVELSFDRFFTAGYGHTFHVLISLDNWNTSTELLSLEYLDGNEEWVKEKIDLSSYSDQNIKLKFLSNDNQQWSSGVALDNIIIGYVPNWLSINSEGYVSHGENESVNFSVNTSEMEQGLYQRSILVENIQTEEIDSLQLFLTVEDLNASLDQGLNPINFNLYQNYPNPFNSSTAIPFSVPLNQQIKLKIYDLLGKEILAVNFNNLAKGHHTFKWDGKSQLGNLVGAGVYFYRLENNSSSFIKKMILLK